MPTVAEQSARIDLDLLMDEAVGVLPLEGAEPRRLTAIVVNEGGQWASLCPELDVASVGSSPEDALDALIDAVRLAVEVAHDNGLEPGQATPEAAVRDFMLRAELPSHLTIFTL